MNKSYTVEEFADYLKERRAKKYNSLSQEARDIFESIKNLSEDERSFILSGFKYSERIPSENPLEKENILKFHHFLVNSAIKYLKQNSDSLPDVDDVSLFINCSKDSIIAGSWTPETDSSLHLERWNSEKHHFEVIGDSY